MRSRIGNPYREAHGKNLRCYEFVADGSKDAAAICTALETSLGIRLQGDPAGQHGYVNTQKMPDGSRFVAVVLYEACAGCEQHSIPLVRAIDPNPAKLAAAKIACGEHPQHKLTDARADAAKLRGLGFQHDDPVLRD